MKNSTGSVITMEHVKPGNQVGIAWASEAGAAAIGFVYNEDETPRVEVTRKISAFTKKYGLKPFGDEYFAEHLDSSYVELRVEEIDQGEFLDRFGGLPTAEMCLFDEGGKIGNNRRVFGIEERFEMPNDAESKKKMVSAARRAGLAGLGLMIVIVALFLVICKFSAMLTGASFAFSVSVLAFVLFVVLGIGELIHLVPKLGRTLYKRMYR